MCVVWCVCLNCMITKSICVKYYDLFKIIKYYECAGGQIKVGLFCQENRSIAAASNNGTVHVFK